jgi:hypothetical protein
LEVTVPARVLNVSAHGMLLAATADLPIGSLRDLVVTLSGRTARVAARACRVEQTDHIKHIALEFVSPPFPLIESLLPHGEQN